MDLSLVATCGNVLENTKINFGLGLRQFASIPQLSTHK